MAIFLTSVARYIDWSGVVFVGGINDTSMGSRGCLPYSMKNGDVSVAADTVVLIKYRMALSCSTQLD